AFDAEGHFLALHVQTFAALGAYLSTFGANIPSAIYTGLFAGGYRTPAIFVEVTGVFSNTTQTDAYRGAGRPEACYVLERLAARVGFYEAASIRIGPDGAVRAALGTHNHGQGHATTFAQIIASRLGVRVENIDIVEGDTGEVPQGTGTFGSRSIAIGGSALD